MSNTKKFNLTINNLIDDLLLVFPDFGNLKLFKEKINLLIKYNPKVTLEYFKNTVYPFHEKIKSKDEDFFLKKSYDNDITVLETDKQWALDEVLNIKCLWKQIKDENKETIWTYFNILIKIIELEYKLE